MAGLEKKIIVVILWETGNVISSKLPGGIQKAAELVKSYGLKFGLWFEPEAISKNSDLYIQHPDYALSVDGYEPTLGRHEYLLDLSREDVQNYLIHMLDSYLSTGLIDYIKGYE